MPNLLHVVPVGDDAVFDRVPEAQDAALGLRLITHVRVLQNTITHSDLVCRPADPAATVNPPNTHLLSHADHHACMARPSNNRWKDSPRGVVSRKASLHHA